VINTTVLTKPINSPMVGDSEIGFAGNLTSQLVESSGQT